MKIESKDRKKFNVLPSAEIFFTTVKTDAKSEKSSMYSLFEEIFSQKWWYV